MALFLDEKPLKGLAPYFYGDHNGDPWVRFLLERTPKDADSWKALMIKTLTERDHKIFVTLRLKDDTGEGWGLPVKGWGLAKNALVNWPRMDTFFVTAVIAILFFGCLAYGSDIIRDAGKQPVTYNTLGQLDRKPYSLARLQLAWWFFVVLVSYVFIFLVTEDLGGLTGSVLTLLGISTATGLGSAAVDSDHQGNNKAKRSAVEQEIADIHSKLDANAPPAGTTEADLKAALAKKTGEMARLDQKISPVSVSFIRDILYDDDGLSLHRFQMVGWTIVASYIFFHSVRQDLTMPDLPTNLLALMGLSGVTFVGLKVPTQQG